MKYLSIVAISIFMLSCKKEPTASKLAFSDTERNWFSYTPGQTLKFKNSLGDSIIFIATNIRNAFKTEFKDPFTNPVAIGETEFYSVDLVSPNDSIFIYFYKEFQYNSDPNKMRQTIRWNSVASQFIYLQTVESQTPFFNKTVNGKIYNKVTQARPTVQTLYPWTKWTNAYYDQQFSFIELIDLNGKSWLRY